MCLCCWTWRWCSEWHTWPGEGGLSWLWPAVPAVKHLGEQAGEHNNKQRELSSHKKGKATVLVHNINKLQWFLGMINHWLWLQAFVCSRKNEIINCAMNGQPTIWCEGSSLPSCCQCSWRSAAQPLPLSHRPSSDNPTETRTSLQSGTTLDV